MSLRDSHSTKEIESLVKLKTTCAICYNSLICVLFISSETGEGINIISPQVKEEMV